MKWAYATFWLSMVAVGAVWGQEVEEIPKVLVQAPTFDDPLYEEYDDLEHREFYFRGLRRTVLHPEWKVWYEEHQECLLQEGWVLRENRLPLSEVMFYFFDEGWRHVRYEGGQIRGVWAVTRIGIMYEPGNPVEMEDTVRHELVHHLIGRTDHPMAWVVGRCAPIVLAGELDAELSRVGRTFPFGVRRIPGQRVGPRP